jgi:uncharacterized protein RhaS with RHS repeats
MRKILFNLLLVGVLFSNTLQAQNPYSSLGIPDEDVKFLTLSQGRYPEFHKDKDFEIIGSVIIDMKNKKIAGFVDRDTLYKNANYELETTTRFFTMDRFAEKYIELTPYQYAGNNPILFIDINGDSISVSSMANGNKIAFLNSLQNSTGLSLYSDGSGNIAYDKNGKKATVSRDENGKKTGSAKARRSLIKSIKNKGTLTVTDKTTVNGSFALVNENIINLDPMQIAEKESSAMLSGINSETVGWGMTFFHELSHTTFGGETLDPTSETVLNDPIGGAVRFTNKIRNQLGYSTRSQYSVSLGTNSDGTRRAISHFSNGNVFGTYSKDRSYALKLWQYGAYAKSIGAAE